jgi:hypothetical protein
MAEIILHCSDSSFGSAVLIDQWHAGQGFKNSYGIHIGYHFVILNGQLNPNKFNKFCDGLIETGRALDDDDKFEFDETAAATLGANDKIQICLIGKSNSFTINQIASVFKVIGWISSIFNKEKVIVKQHSDYDPKNRPYCAGFSKEQMSKFNG